MLEDMSEEEIREEAKILSIVAQYIAQGRIKTTLKQKEMITTLVDEIYRRRIRQNQQKEKNNEKELGE